MTIPLARVQAFTLQLGCACFEALLSPPPPSFSTPCSLLLDFHFCIRSRLSSLSALNFLKWLQEPELLGGNHDKASGLGGAHHEHMCTEAFCATGTAANRQLGLSPNPGNLLHPGDMRRRHRASLHFFPPRL